MICVRAVWTRKDRSRFTDKSSQIFKNTGWFPQEPNANSSELDGFFKL